MVVSDMQIGLFIGALMGIGIGIIIMVMAGEGRQKPINTSIKKDEAKVVNKTTVVDLQDKVKDGKPVAYCRCWKSKTFPYCDGSHAKWNEATKDNVGPLVVTGK